METIGPAPIFAVMAILHPVAAVVLWSMVRPEQPNEPQTSTTDAPSGIIRRGGC
jgi:ACS family hexuronate transporter-like MFS transporter